MRRRLVIRALIRHAVRAFTGFVTADPCHGRVLFIESMSAWLEQRVTLPRDRFVEHLAQVIENLGQAGSAPTAG